MMRLPIAILISWAATAFRPMAALSPPIDGVSGQTPPELQEDLSSLITVGMGASVSEMDLKETKIVSYGGAVKKGSYGYLAPKMTSEHGQGDKVIRFDLNRLVEAGTLDLSSLGENVAGFLGIFDDGTYGYLVPFHNKVVRFKLDSFSDPEVLVLADELTDFSGGFSAGDYGYLIPSGEASSKRHGTVVRFDLASFSKVETLDLVLGATPTDTSLKGFAGGFQDGTYGYAVPRENDEGKSGKVARFDLATFKEVTVLNLQQKDVKLAGFQGGFTNGDFGYLVPEDNGAQGGGSEFGMLTRFSLSSFDVGSVTTLDLTKTDGELSGFYQGFTDGSYAYLSPGKHGKLARIALATFPDSPPDAINIGVDLKGFEAGFADPETNSGYLVCADAAETCKGKVARINNISPAGAATTTAAPDADNGGGGGLFWAGVVIIILVAVGGAGGYYMYLQKQEQAAAREAGTEMPQPDRQT